MAEKLNKIYLGNSTDYNTHASSETLDENSIYFIEDSDTKVKSIYKGATKIGGDFLIVDAIPDEAEEGVIYFIKNYEDNEPFCGININGEWVSICKDVSDEFLKKQDKLTAGSGITISDDNTISTNIDLSLYKIVSALPTENIDDSKIYLVIDTTAVEGNKYKEYIHHTNGWELLGEYKAEIPINEYIKTVDADKKYVQKSTSDKSTISISTNGSFNNYGDNGQAFNAVRNLSGTTKYTGSTGSDYPLNAASFGVKDNGATAFSHKKYDSFNPETGAYTGAKNTAVLIFSGHGGLMYAKNTGSASDVTEAMYKYVGVIDSPDEKQRVYSSKQVDDLLKAMNDKITALEARVTALEGN